MRFLLMGPTRTDTSGHACTVNISGNMALQGMAGQDMSALAIFSQNIYAFRSQMSLDLTEPSVPSLHKVACEVKKKGNQPKPFQ